MKKNYLLSILLVLFCNFLYSQWAPNGAKWYYNEPNSTNPNCITYESIQDTIIQSSNCKIIEVKRNNATLIGKEYIKQNGDSIFYYNYYANSFHLLYNFSSKVGDTINVHLTKFKPTKAFFSYDSINNFRYKIIALDSIQVSGNWVKRQKVLSLNANDWGFPIAITQEHYILNEIGSLTYFFVQQEKSRQE